MTKALRAVRLIGMAALVWGTVVSENHPANGDRRVVLLVLVLASAAAYGGWAYSLRRAPRFATAFLVAWALAAGPLGAFTGLGIVMLILVGMGAGDRLETRPALGVVALEVGGLVIGIASVGASWTLLGWAALAGIGGLLAGMNRRQARLQTEQAQLLLAEKERTQLEAEHSATLAERNRIAREIHDVLAHSLGALAVQLEALDALVAAGDLTRAAEVVATSRGLALSGLDETRRAVHALRDAPLAFAERVEELARMGSASFLKSGDEAVLGPAASLALYRAAQEALTNARKHAPGAPVALSLSFEAGEVRLSVVNGDGRTDGRPPAALGRNGNGGGYGLAGMRERVELAGGSMSAGPTQDGWQVAVSVPGGAT